MNNRNDVPMHNLPLTANNTDKLSNIAKPTQEAQNESNRYCEKNRRSRQSRYSEGDQADNENPGGRPLTENIDTGYGVLHECGIGCGAVHREVNDMPAGAPRPPSALFVADGGSCSFRTLDCLTNAYINVITINTY